MAGGLLGFLPVLGLWMVPLGLLVLSYDVPGVRRWRRRFEVWFFRWWRGQTPRGARQPRGLKAAAVVVALLLLAGTVVLGLWLLHQNGVPMPL